MILYTNYLYYRWSYDIYKRILYIICFLAMNTNRAHPFSSWFTVIELLVAIFIISLVILWVVTMIQAATWHINKIRQETIAINLAREWIEGMYTRRNTNWTKRSAEKDKYRLCIDNDCSERFHENAVYKLSYTPSTWNKIVNFTMLDPLSSSPYWSSSPMVVNDTLLQTGDFISHIPSWGEYYRAILPKWLYQKDVNIVWWHKISCTSWDENYSKLNFDWSDAGSTPCSDETPKEFLFCSRVEYQWNGAGNGNVELCWSLTNYME